MTTKENELNSKKRTEFYGGLNFPFYDATTDVKGKEINFPYALYTCKEISKDFADSINQATVEVAAVFDHVLKIVEKWDAKDFETWKYPKEAVELLNLYSSPYFCLRAGWGFDEDNQLKLIEINAHTPGFWIESEFGNPLLAKEFGLKNIHPHSKEWLKTSLNTIISESLNNLPNCPKDPKVGFVVCDYYEDMDNINWLSSLCDYSNEVVKVRDFDFTLRNRPYNLVTNTEFDCVFLWYPVNWLMEEYFQNGESVFKIIVRALEQKTFALAHAIPAYLIQSKSLLAYITENADDIFTGELASARKYFTETHMELPKGWSTYFKKPIWGHEGRGVSYIKNNKKIAKGRYFKDKYTKLDMIYQKALNLPTERIADKDLILQYECWAYRVGDSFKPGAMGIRCTENLVTDDYSYWLPVGLEK